MGRWRQWGGLAAFVRRWTAGADGKREDLPADPIALLQRLSELANECRRGRSEPCRLLLGTLIAAATAGTMEVQEAARRWLATQPPSLWLKLDEKARYPSWVRSPVGSLNEPSRLRGTLLVGLASLHPDGYMRETAVRQLAASDDPLAGGFLALRAGDWVPQVREPAQAAIRELLGAPALLAAVPILLAVDRRERGRAAFRSVEDRLRSADTETLHLLTTSRDVRTRRFAIELLHQRDVLSTDELVEFALRDPDLVIRTECATRAMKIARDRGDEDVARRLITSSSTAVRLVALDYLTRAGENMDLLERHLLNRAAGVRQFAQQRIRTHRRDPAESYRAVLVDPPEQRRAAAVHGLGETGVPGDVPLVARFLDDRSPGVRQAAVKATRRLAEPGRRLELFAERLFDPAPSVVAEVERTLRPVARELPRDLLDRAASSDLRRTRLAAWQLRRRRGPWHRVEADLWLISDSEPHLVARARTDLASWIERTAPSAYARPDTEHAQRLAALLEGTPLDERTRGSVRFHAGLDAS